MAKDKSGQLVARGNWMAHRVQRALVAVLVVAGAWVSASPVFAAESDQFAAARVVPADVQAFFAVTADDNDPQVMLAKELLTRAGLPASSDVAASTAESVVPGASAQLDLATMIDGGQIAVGIRVVDNGLLANLPDLDSIVGDGQQLPSTDGLAVAGPTGVAAVLTATNLDDVIASVEAEATAGQEQEIDGTRVFVVEDAGGGIAEDGMPATTVIAVLDEALVIAAAVEDVVPYIEVSNGNEPALEQNSDYQTVMQRLPSESLMVGYTVGVGPGALDVIDEAIQQSNLPIAIDLLLGATGPTGVSVAAASEGFRFESVQLRADDAATPSPATATAAPAELSLDERLPDDTLLFVNGTDLGASFAFRALEQLFIAVLSGTSSTSSEPLPELNQQFFDQQYAGLELLLGFNLQTELIRQLTGEYGFALTNVDLLDPANIGVLLVSGVSDPETVGNSLASVGLLIQSMSEGSSTVSSITVGDYSVNQIQVESDGAELAVQYGVADDQLIVSTGDALVEYVLGSSGALADDPVFQEALGYLPSQYDGLFYLNTPELVELGSSVLGPMLSATEESGLPDSSARCGDFADQQAAQSAYDEDPVANFDLDVDFDGQACDDFFQDSAATTPTIGFELSVNLGGLALVSQTEDDATMTSGILVIPDAA